MVWKDNLRERNSSEDNLPIPQQCCMYLYQLFDSLLIHRSPYSTPAPLAFVYIVRIWNCTGYNFYTNIKAFSVSINTSQQSQMSIGYVVFEPLLRHVSIVVHMTTVKSE